jgi:hypothetical protein
MARAESLKGKRPVGYCHRSRDEDANRACKEEHDFEHSPRLVARHMRHLWGYPPAISTNAPVMQLTAATKRISSDTVNTQLLRILRLNCFGRINLPVEQPWLEWLTKG